MTPQEIAAIVCQCQLKNYEDTYRHSITHHILCRQCHKPFQSLARFRCIGCGELAVNKHYYHEFNLLNDYDFTGKQVTKLLCKDCND